MVFMHLFVSIQVTGNFQIVLRGAMLEVDREPAEYIVALDDASPAERKVIHVATPAAGSSLDCSFDRIHNLIISYYFYVFIYICI